MIVVMPVVVVVEEGAAQHVDECKRVAGTVSLRTCWARVYPAITQRAANRGRLDEKSKNSSPGGWSLGGTHFAGKAGQSLHGLEGPEVLIVAARVCGLA
jgi:hypothetical protein